MYQTTLEDGRNSRGLLGSKNFTCSSCLEVAAKQKVYKMKQSWRQASMQVSNSSVARPWKLEQNTSGQAWRQASRQASGLRTVEIGAKQYDKEGALFLVLKRKKGRRAKMGFPSSSFHSLFFFDRRPVPFGRSRHLRLIRLPRHDRGPVPGGNRSAANCLCTVLRRALYQISFNSK